MRSEKGYRKGGTRCDDKTIVKKYRGVAKDIIK